MAPARMISFMEQHVADCDICLGDGELKEELVRIREIVLPESKVPKAVRMQEQEELDDEEELDTDSDSDDEELDDDEDLDEDFEDFDDDI